MCAKPLRISYATQLHKILKKQSLQTLVIDGRSMSFAEVHSRCIELITVLPTGQILQNTEIGCALFTKHRIIVLVNPHARFSVTEMHQLQQLADLRHSLTIIKSLSAVGAAQLQYINSETLHWKFVSLFDCALNAHAQPIINCAEYLLEYTYNVLEFTSKQLQMYFRKYNNFLNSDAAFKTFSEQHQRVTEITTLLTTHEQSYKHLEFS